MTEMLKEKPLKDGHPNRGLINTNRRICTTDGSASTVSRKQENPLTALQCKAHNIYATGHMLVPYWLDKRGPEPDWTPKPYKDLTKSYTPELVKAGHKLFGVRLGRMVLLDLDGHKTVGAPTKAELLGMLGLPLDLPPVQWGTKPGSDEHNGSYHWLFRLSDEVDIATLTQNNTGVNNLVGVDVLFGNQLINFKDGKTLPGDTLPQFAELPEAPASLLAWITAPKRKHRELAPVAPSDETSVNGAYELEEAGEIIRSTPEGKRNREYFKQSCRIGELVASGDVAKDDAEDALTSAAEDVGLDTHGKDAGTLASGINKGMLQPRKASQVTTVNDFDGVYLQDINKDNLEKMRANQLGHLLAGQLGKGAVCRDTGVVYRYDAGIWVPMSDTRLAPVLAKVFNDAGADYNAKKITEAVNTMKMSLREMAPPVLGVIGFANGVYDLMEGQFLPHSPDYFLPSHNGIVYDAAGNGETLEQAAPSFYRWLSHAAGGDASRMDRINAALYMVLTNRWDWQLFLEVTGEGGSGKSVMANLCELLVGKENVGSTSMDAMKSSFGLENVWDKRLILLPDQPKFIGDGGFLKGITGGDEVRVNPKGKTAFSTKVRAIVLATNNEPMVMTEHKGGMVRRRVIFAFNNVVDDAHKDSRLGLKIANELPVIIRHLLTRFAEPEFARGLLLEQRDGDDALAIKKETNPVLALCSMLKFLDEPRGVFMGGGKNAPKEPRSYLYHLYLEYMEHMGLKPLAVQNFSTSVKEAAKILKTEYRTRDVNGRAQTNVELTEAAVAFLPPVDDLSMA